MPPRWTNRRSTPEALKLRKHRPRPVASGPPQGHARHLAGRGRAVNRSTKLDRVLPWVLALAALLLGAWLRIHRTHAFPLWLDESYSAYIADRDLGFIWGVVPKFETHPPFYYSILHGWTLLFGDALAARRALGIACGLLTIPVAAFAAREAARLLGWSRARTGWAMGVVAAFVALSPMQIEMTRQVRPYPVLILAAAIALFALLRLADIARSRRRIAAGPLLLYAAMLALVLWLHNLGVFTAGAFGLASLLLLGGRGLGRRDWRLFWGVHAVVALLYLPAFLMLVDQASGWAAASWLEFVPGDLVWNLSRLLAAPGRPGFALGLIGGIAGLIVAGRTRGGWRVAAALLLCALVPITLSIAVTLLKSPIFLTRTLSTTTVPALILIGIGLAGARGMWRWPGAIAGLLLCALMVRVAAGEIASRPMQDWYAATDWLAAHVRPGEEVWVYPNDAAAPLRYAAHDRGQRALIAALRPQPGPVPVFDAGTGVAYPTGNRGVPTLPLSRLQALADASQARNVSTIWLVRLRPGMFDPADDFPAALANGRTPVPGCTSPPIEIRGYAIGMRNGGLGQAPPCAIAR
jgi:mannosyltransferase